ncbi:MAG: putative ABC transporter permease [Oscillospiraceae bacterium]|nr:putative ABC transporter permease [Oscillospiraceae bacterium]
MDEHNTLAPSQAGSLAGPAALELETVCNAIPAAVERTGRDLEDRYYVRLAEEALAPKWPDGKPPAETQQLLDAAQAELDHLRQTAKSLVQSYQSVVGLEDELGARIQDVRKSRDRKWYASNPPANAGIDLEEQRQNHFAQGINIYKILLVCIVGSFAGVVIEMMWAYARYGLIESRRGLVYGPFNLLYGAGAVFLTLALYKYRNKGRIWSFLGGFIVGSALEYACSWGQEALLGSRSWDYSNFPLNLNGRICFTYSVFWGILGIVWIKDLYPRMAKWILKIPNSIGKTLTWALTVFMVFNCAVSCVTMGRWVDRRQGVPAGNSFWEFVDQRFPNERMERIFANMSFGDES